MGKYKKSKILSLFLSIVLMLLLFSSCSKDSSDTTVMGFLDSVVRFDLVKSEDYLFKDSNSYDFLCAIFTFDDDFQRELASKTFSKIKYKITSKEKIDDESKKIKVRINHVNYIEIAQEIKGKIPDNILKSNDTSVKDNYINKLLIKKLQEPAVPTIDSEIEILLNKADDKWYIVPDDNLIDALSGNMIGAFNIIDEGLTTE